MRYVVYRVEIRGRLFGQLMVNVFHYKMVPDGTPQLLVASSLTADVHNRLQTSVLPWGTGVSIEKISAMSQSPPGTRHYRDYAEILNPGGLTLLPKAPLQQHITVVLNKHCAQRGRGYRGFTQVFGWPQDYTANGLVNEPDATNFLTQYMLFIQAPYFAVISEDPRTRYANLVPIIWTSRRLDRVAYAAYPDKPITNVTYRPALGCLRRRQLGVGA